MIPSGTNSLPIWEEQEIEFRNYLIRFFGGEVTRILSNENRAWRFLRVESSPLALLSSVSDEYDKSDFFQIADSDMCLRPETTKGSYSMAEFLLSHHTKLKPPICVWQAGLSFRREQDATMCKMKLKSFYQQEFQCLFHSSSKNSYINNSSHQVSCAISNAIGKKTSLIVSDRIPSYSSMTLDVVDPDGLELCSMSLRNDYPDTEMSVFEIAIGLDRCVYSWSQEEA